VVRLSAQFFQDALLWIGAHKTGSNTPRSVSVTCLRTVRTGWIFTSSPPVKEPSFKTAELKPAAPPRPDFEFPGHRRTSSASQLNAKGSPRRSRGAAACLPQTERTKASGNVAFKVTWVYGKNGPFSAPCTPDGRRKNIENQRIWCSDKECLCNKLYRIGDLREVTPEERPCMDSEIFTAWKFGTGVYHHGPKKDDSIPIKSARPGKLAFFTSRRFDMSEAERIVLGCYKIDELGFDSNKGGTFLHAKQGSQFKINLDALSDAPRFWDFYKSSGPPFWGSGLFRYLGDDLAKTLRDAVIAAATATNL
jgi:hypothetical protein